MAKRIKTTSRPVKMYLDPVGNTLNIWWGDPKKASYSEEVSSAKSNDVMIMDKAGKPISLEIIGVFPAELNVSKIIKKVFNSKNEPYILLSA